MPSLYAQSRQLEQFKNEQYFAYNFQMCLLIATVVFLAFIQYFALILALGTEQFLALL